MQGRSIYDMPKAYNKPHKFFEKYLDNDLNKMTTHLIQVYRDMQNATLRGVSPVGSENDKFWIESGSISTVKWTEYNVFQFYTDEIYNVYSAVKDLTLEACDYYGVDFKKQKYYIQGWFNINDRKVGKLNWHDHGGPWAPFWHGYYCIKAEPSSTFYKLENKDDLIVENHNKDNRLILSEMGHPHAMGDWDWDGPRITLAYDVAPLSSIKMASVTQQHWIPLV
jgi:hypothetical protein